MAKKPDRLSNDANQDDFSDEEAEATLKAFKSRQGRTLSVDIAPGTKVPAADHGALRPLGANKFYPRVWQYRHRQHLLTDFMRPGYFTGEARAMLRPGDEIYYCLECGSKTPSEWTRGMCVVEEVPSSRELPLTTPRRTPRRRPDPHTTQESNHVEVDQQRTTPCAEARAPQGAAAHRAPVSRPPEPTRGQGQVAMPLLVALVAFDVAFLVVLVTKGE
jgi:hypothetical protein